MMSEQNSLLNIESLTKRFGGLTAVDDVSFKIDAGQVVGLIGPNGSGKTTVFNCIMSVHDPTEGKITFNNKDITSVERYSIVNAGIARISQHSNPIEPMTIAENIRLYTQPNSILSFAGGASDMQIKEYAEQVGISEDLDAHPGSVPFGTVRKLEIAKALATEPEMLLIDEPFAGLNAEETNEIAELIQQINAKGTTIVVVDHNMHGLMPIVEEVITLNNGEKIAQGTPDEVVSNKRVQQAYLAGTGDDLDV
jgi:branched-chain amino acid transport system ATP-binding protein